MRKDVSPDSVCRDFDRAAESLIEEPEVCENCRHYDAGQCEKEEQDAQP